MIAAVAVVRRRPHGVDVGKRVMCTSVAPWQNIP
jgi:hypothetical protein